MAKKRIYQIAKEQGLANAELVKKLQAAGLDVKTASSSVEEGGALKVIGKRPDSDSGAKEKTAASSQKPVVKKTAAASTSKSSGTDKPAVGRKRRVVIDAGATYKRPEPKLDRAPPDSQKKEPVEKKPTEESAEQLPETNGKLHVSSGATVKEFASTIDTPVAEIIKTLMGFGEMASITQSLSDEAIMLVAEELGQEVDIVHVSEEIETEPIHDDAPADLVSRPPVVVVMGHVDHGKTSLLDAIRKTEVVAGEAGGITQHIGAYQVHHNDKLLAFLDTPGHEAFTAMRARGAKVTDIAVIVVAADDGVKPQTEEAIHHAKAAEVPMIVAVNKVDKEGAQPEKVRSELSNIGLAPEEWGGDTVFCDVSAKTGQGLNELLDMLILVSDVQELKANPKAPASGTVIESKLDPGRGAVATILVQRGTMRVGDALVAGAHWARVKAMNDHLGTRVDQAKPGDAVEVLGFSSVPSAGEHVRSEAGERDARQSAEGRAMRIRAEQISRKGVGTRLEDIFARAKAGITKLNLVVKTDVAGSLEALEDELAKLPQGEISLNIIHAAVGGINESDVMLAAASNGLVLAFNVRPTLEARTAADREAVDIRTYTVIYKLVDELRAAMEGLLEPEEVQEDLGVCEVRQVFKASKIGAIAGCHVTDGKIARNAKIRLVRDGAIVFEGEIGTLRRFKDDVREVEKGFECGIVVKDYADIKEGDTIEAYVTKHVERQLA